MGPFEQVELRTLTTTFQIAVPSVLIMTGIDGYHTDLRTEATGNLVDEFRPSECRTVDAHLIRAGMQQAFHVGQFVDASADGERNIDLAGYAFNHFREGFSSLEGGCDVKKHQLVGTCIAVGFTKFYWVAGTAQVHKVGAFYRFAVLYIQTRDDALGQ